ncbi:hypothetical protein FOL47_005340 [Perkinsus chesapeaki]|uniref:Uncharacterized protein n=1 Tax=Perkinsus chesapeaki TaxID=330153 RepID=A0A7J6LYH7_PERCH|nr:hypothetical protein FOL47_005340 [Perkinsus chesapeaki]
MSASSPTVTNRSRPSPPSSPKSSGPRSKGAKRKRPTSLSTYENPEPISWRKFSVAYATMWGKIANFTGSLAEESYKSLNLPYQDLKTRRQTRDKAEREARKDLETQVKQEQRKVEKMKRSVNENTTGLANFIKMMKHKAPDQKYTKNQYAELFNKLPKKDKQCFTDGTFADNEEVAEKALGRTKKSKRSSNRGRSAGRAIILFANVSAPKKEKKPGEFDNFINDNASSSSESSEEVDDNNSSSGSSSSGAGSSSGSSSGGSDRESVGSSSSSSSDEEGDPMGKITKRRHSKGESPRKQLERDAQPIIKKFTWT